MNETEDLAKLAADSANQNASLNEINFSMDKAITVDSSDYLMFPIARYVESDDKSNKKSSDYRAGRRELIWNVLFYNTANGDYHYLANDTMIIKSWNLFLNNPNMEDEEQTKVLPFIIWQIITEDTDISGFLSNADAEYLYMTNRDGKNMKGISPEKSDVTSWQLLPDSTHILMHCRQDSNRNMDFDSNDEVLPYLYNIDDLAEPALIANSAELLDMFRQNRPPRN